MYYNLVWRKGNRVKFYFKRNFKELCKFFYKFDELRKIYDEGTRNFIWVQRCRSRKQDSFNMNSKRGREQKIKYGISIGRVQTHKHTFIQKQERFISLHGSEKRKREAERNYKEGIVDKRWSQDYSINSLKLNCR